MLPVSLKLETMSASSKDTSWQMAETKWYQPYLIPQPVCPSDLACHLQTHLWGQEKESKLALFLFFPIRARHVHSRESRACRICSDNSKTSHRLLVLCSAFQITHPEPFVSLCLSCFKEQGFSYLQGHEACWPLWHPKTRCRTPPLPLSLSHLRQPWLEAIRRLF